MLVTINFIPGDAKAYFVVNAPLGLDDEINMTGRLKASNTHQDSTNIRCLQKASNRHTCGCVCVADDFAEWASRYAGPTPISGQRTASLALHDPCISHHPLFVQTYVQTGRNIQKALGKNFPDSTSVVLPAAVPLLLDSTIHCHQRTNRQEVAGISGV